MIRLYFVKVDVKTGGKCLESDSGKLGDVLRKIQSIDGIDKGETKLLLERPMGFDIIAKTDVDDVEKAWEIKKRIADINDVEEVKVFREETRVSIS